MTPIVRGVLILIIISLGITLFLFQDRRKMSLSKRCYECLLYIAYLYPFMELGIERLGLVFSPIKVLVLVFLFINPFLWRYFLKKRFRYIRFFVLICLICAFFSDYILNSILSIYTYLILLFIFFIGIKATEYRGVDYVMLNLLIPMVVWVVLFAIIQVFIDPQFTFRDSSRQAENRLDLCFVDPQTAGTVCSMFAAYFFSKTIFTSNKTWLLIACLLIVIVGLTGSKACFMGLGVSIILILFYAGIKPSTFSLICLLGVVIVGSYDYWSQLPVFTRMQEFNDSFEGREELYWMSAIKVFLDNPIIGIGPGNFLNYNIDHIGLTHHSNDAIIYASQPESGYLLLLDEFGIFAVIPLILFFSLFRLRNKSYINFALLLPWVFSFISLANLSYGTVAFVFGVFCALIYKTNRMQEIIKSKRIERVGI